MINHLPECFAVRPHGFIHVCICDRLRACEQRVADEIWGAIRDGSQYKSGFEGGVDTAREAVAERESEFMRITESDRDSWACRIYGDALAAIDALKEDK